MTPHYLAQQYIDLYKVGDKYSAILMYNSSARLASPDDWHSSAEEAINSLWSPNIPDDPYTARDRPLWKREYDAGKVPVQKIWHD